MKKNLSSFKMLRARDDDLPGIPFVSIISSDKRFFAIVCNILILIVKTRKRERQSESEEESDGEQGR